MSRKALNVNNNQIDFSWALRNESRDLNFTQINNISAYPFPGSGGSNASYLWKTATKPTVTAGNFIRIVPSLIQSVPGRCACITEITVDTTDVVEIQIVKYRNIVNALGSPSSTFTQSYTVVQLTKVVNSSFNATWTWSDDNPLLVRPGEQIAVYYKSDTTTGTNWKVNAKGVDITNDFDYNAELTIAVIGDSISGVTANTGDLQYVERENGTKAGMWPFILKNNLLNEGIESRLVNLGQGGTYSNEWDWWVNSGKIQNLKAQALFINLGMNDSSNSVNLSTTAGVDGVYKSSIKNIIRSYFRVNQGGSCFVNQITDTDETTRSVIISGGIYNGLTRLAAYRQDLVAAINELKTANPNWDLFLVPMDTAYSSSDATNYIEATVNTKVHPNYNVGQPKMAVIATTSFKLSKAYLNRV